jgi:hypothetical protein
MDVSGAKDNENQNVLMWNKHGKLNQQWDLVFVDEWKTYQKGELNNEFGLYVERDFHILTELSSHRYLSIANGKDMMIKTPNGFKSQIWYFHQDSLTIRTRENNRSWDIKNSGRTNNMQVWTTNSGWY